MTTYTRENVTEALEEAVALKGEEYMYPGAGMARCFYSEENADGTRVPSCIVGHVIAKIDPEGFERISHFEERQNESRSARTVLLWGAIKGVEQIEDRVLANALSVAQSVQDNGQPWGAALAAFQNSLAIANQNM